MLGSYKPETGVNSGVKLFSALCEVGEVGEGVGDKGARASASTSAFLWTV